MNSDSDHKSQHKLDKTILFLSVFVGLIAGLFAVGYRVTIGAIEIFRPLIFDNLTLINIIVFFTFSIVFSKVITELIHWAPYSNGSGIPQIRAEISDKISAEPIPTITSKFLGGALTNLIGYSLGREGPSIQIGGMVGKFIAQSFHIDYETTKILITTGASAGLAAAFNAPLAGILFSVEELYGKTSRIIVIPGLIACAIANLLSYVILGYHDAFHYSLDQQLPLNYLLPIIVLGILAGFIGSLFNWTLIQTQKLFQGLKIQPLNLIIIVSWGVIITGMFLPKLLGGGHSLIETFIGTNYPLKTLLVLLFGKIILTSVSYSSGVQGGIFLPVIAIGATLGIIFSNLATTGIIPEGYQLNFLILGMVGVLTAVVQSPLMSIILVVEMMGSFNHLILMIVVAVTALLTTEFLKVPPIYDSLYHQLLKRIQD